MGCGAGVSTQREQAYGKDSPTQRISEHLPVGVDSESDRPAQSPEQVKADAAKFESPVGSSAYAHVETSRCLSALVDLLQTYQSDTSALRVLNRDSRAPELLIEEGLSGTASSNPPRAQILPLISPKYINAVASILDVDLIREPEMVAAMKTLLSALGRAFASGGINIETVQWCFYTMERERDKRVARFSVTDAATHEADAAQYCSECDGLSTLYCPECEDLFCATCFDRLHAKGNRAQHPRLEKTLAGYKARRPVSTTWASSQMEQQQEGELFSRPAPVETNFGHGAWHAFYDSLGVKYYHNFETQKSVRRPLKEDVLWLPPPPLPLPASSAAT